MYLKILIKQRVAIKQWGFSLPWLVSRLKKPEICLFQNTGVTLEAFEQLNLQRIEYYRSFWGNLNKKTDSGGFATYSRKHFPAIVSPYPLLPPLFTCSHNYYPVVPFPRHAIFTFPGLFPQFFFCTNSIFIY